jgi:hypothetical protein
MRVPEQFLTMKAVRIATALSAAIALCSSCAGPPPIQISYDEREDLTRFHTWDWIEGDPVYVYAPFDPAGVEQRLSAIVEGALRQRGLERAPGKGELRVAAMLVGTRRVDAYRRARAVQTLYSHHDIGGYEVQGEDVERRTVDRCRLAIYITGSHQERMLWQAVAEERYSSGCAPQLDADVARLLASFPPPAPGQPARESSAPER